MPSNFINEIILVIIAAFLGGFIARSIKLPPVVGYLISGIIFGVVGKSFLASFDSLFAISQIGISLLLFTLGFEISIDMIRKINKKILFASTLQIVISSVALIPVLSLLHFSFGTSVLFSILFSFSSTAVIVKILEEKGMLNNFPGNNVFIFLLIQDLFIVPVIFLIPFIFKNSFIFPNDLINFTIIAVKPLIVFLVILFLSRFFLSKLLNLLFRYPSQELTILATIFTAVVTIGLLTSVGMPSSIAAFFAGVLISEEGKNLAPLAAIRPLRDILLVTFFVLTGMLVNLDFMMQHFVLIILVTVLVLLVKFVVLLGILRFFRFLPASNIFISSHMANIGEFAAVVGQIALVGHFIDKNSYESLLSVFILSLITIPFSIRFTKLFFTKYKNHPIVQKLGVHSHYFSNPTFEVLENHVIICGHGRVGREVRNLMDIAGATYAVVDFNRKVIDDLAKSSKVGLYGDPTDPDVLKSAGIQKAKILVVAVPDSFTQKMIIKTALHLNQKLVVLCRSHIDEDKYELVNLGVNAIVIPEFEAGLRIGKQVLEFMGYDEKETFEMTRKLRKFHLIQ